MNDLERSLIESASLPTLPSIAQRLLGLLHDDVGIDQLTRVIEVDPAITARLLRLVNSPMYGVSREIGSLHEALAHLGMNTVRSIALSFSFAEGLRAEGLHDEDGDETLDGLWRVSLMTALAARRLAQETGHWDESQAFVAGLLLDAGALVMYPAVHGYPVLVQRFLTGEGDLIELERERLTTDHARVGALLLEAWDFPPELCRLVERHHADAGTHAEEDWPARLLDAAWMTARVLSVEGFRHEVTDLCARLVQRTGLSPQSVESVLADLPRELREIAQAFAIPATEQRSYQELLCEAAEALRNIAIEADRSAYLYAAATGGGRSGFEDIRQALRPTLGIDRATLLLQRRAMERLLEAFHVRAEQRRSALGLMVLELETRKDEAGRDVTEAALVALAARLRPVVRDEDELARFGPRQIAIVMPACEREDLLGAAQRIRRCVTAEEIEAVDLPCAEDVTIGAASVMPHGHSSDFGVLVAQVQDALERARATSERVSL